MTNTIAAAAVAAVLFFAGYGIGYHHTATITPAGNGVQTVTVAATPGRCVQLLRHNQRTAIRALTQALEGNRPAAMNLAAHIAAITDRCAG